MIKLASNCKISNHWEKKLVIQYRLTLHAYKIFQLHCGDNHTTNLHFLHDICVLLYFFYQRLALVCGSNSVIERLFSKKQQQEANLCSHNTFPVGGARESIQRKASLENSFTQLSKLVLS